MKALVVSHTAPVEDAASTVLIAIWARHAFPFPVLSAQPSHTALDRDAWTIFTPFSLLNWET
jgi:hypothetical protein